MSGGPGRREVAHRLFAAEYDDASLEYAESDEERAPNFVVTPTGARVNRLFVVGVLTSVEQVNEDTVRARIADPTGAFVVYAGQYQPDELAALQSLEPPAFVAMTGKANAFTPDGSDRVLTSVRPESVAEVEAGTRDGWVVTAAEHSLGRIETAADALGREARGDDLVALLSGDGVEPGLAEGVAKALEHYGTTADYLGELREVALQAVEVVAGEREEADSLDLAPDEETGEYAPSDLVAAAPGAATAVTEVVGEPAVVAPGEDAAADGTTADDVAAEETVADQTAGGETTAETDAEPEADVDAGTETGAAAETDAASETDGESKTATESPTETGSQSASGPEPQTESPSASDSKAETESPSASDSKAGTGSPSATDSEAEPESQTETEPSTTDSATGSGAETEDASDAEPSEEPEEVVDDEERERIEEEYGVGFESGTEVDDPGEADMEAPDAEATAEAEQAGSAGTDAGASDVEEAQVEEDRDEAASAGDAADAPAEPESEDEGAEAEAEAEAEAGDATDGEAADDDTADDSTADDAAADDDLDQADVESALLEEMEALDEDDGAERSDLVATVAAATGASDDAVEDAIEDALMDGRCYEPSEGRYKPI